MRILTISDPHFHAFKQHASMTDTGMNSRLADTIAAFKKAISIGKEHDCKALFLPGDMFHVRGVLKPSVFNEVFWVFHEAAQEIPIFMIAGNHDQETMAGDQTAIDVFEEIDGVRVLDCGPEGNCFLPWPGFRSEHKGPVIAGIPYCHSAEEFKALYEKVAEKKPAVIMIHQGIDDLAMPGLPEVGITTSYLSSVHDGWVLAGHYHTPKRAGKVIQVGALTQQSFSDEGQDRGCWVLDTDTDEAEFICIPSPRFITVESMRDVEILNITGNFIRIKTDDLAQAKKLREACEEAKAASIVVAFERKFATAHEKAIPVSTPSKMLTEYIDMMPLYAGHKTEIVGLYDMVCSSGV